MDEMRAFELQVAETLHRMAGPGRFVDPMVMTRTVASTHPRWRLRSMFSTTRFVVAGAIVALFAGFLAAGVPPASPERHDTPGAATSLPSGVPATSTASPGATLAPRPPATFSNEVTARLVVDPGPDPTVLDLAGAEAALERYALMAETPGVAEAVIDELELDESVESLLGRVSTTIDRQTLVLTIRVTGDDREAARLVGQAIGDEMRQRVLDQVVTVEARVADTAIARSERFLSTLQSRYDGLRRMETRTQRDRAEQALLASQIESLQAHVADLRASSSASVRNRLEWLEQPAPSTPESLAEE